MRPDLRSVTLRTQHTHPSPTPQPTPCRLWQGSTLGKGYGRKFAPETGRMVTLHRWVMQQVYGAEAIAGKVVMHLCDNPACFRFDHLRIGTVADNTHDMIAKGRWSPPPAPSPRPKCAACGQFAVVSTHDCPKAVR
jgi:hypothetical protein